MQAVALVQQRLAKRFNLFSINAVDDGFLLAIRVDTQTVVFAQTASPISVADAVFGNVLGEVFLGHGELFGRRTILGQSFDTFEHQLPQ